MKKFYDPQGELYGIPTFPWNLAPAGLLTRTQLREGWALQPGTQEPAAQIMWRSNKARRDGFVRVAYLYRRELARPIRPMTEGMWRSHAAMMRARRICPECGRDVGYVIRTSVGMCETCALAPHAPALAAA